MVKEGDDLMAATRYAIMMLHFASTKTAYDNFHRRIEYPRAIYVQGFSKMAVYDDIYRLGTAAALTVASAAGAAVSTAIFGTETYAIAISFPGSTSSTSGVGSKSWTPPRR